MCVAENIQISSALAGSLTPVEIRPGVAVATVTGNLVVKDNTYTLNTLEDEEEGEITRVKRERDSGETDGKVCLRLCYSCMFAPYCGHYICGHT